MNCCAAVLQSDFKHRRVPSRSRSQTKHKSFLLRYIIEYGMIKITYTPTITTRAPEGERAGDRIE